MAEPDELPFWDTDEENIERPPAGLLATGYVLDQVPLSRHVNWWQNKVYQWAEYFSGELGTLRSVYGVDGAADDETISLAIATRGGLTSNNAWSGTNSFSNTSTFSGAATFTSATATQFQPSSTNTTAARFGGATVQDLQQSGIEVSVIRNRVTTRVPFALGHQFTIPVSGNICEHVMLNYTSGPVEAGSVGPEGREIAICIIRGFADDYIVRVKGEGMIDGGCWDVDFIVDFRSTPYPTITGLLPGGAGALDAVGGGSSDLGFQVDTLSGAPETGVVIELINSGGIIGTTSTARVALDIRIMAQVV